MQTPRMTRIRLMMVNAAAVALLLMICGAPGVAQPRNPRPPFPAVDSSHPSNEALRAYLTSLHFLADHVSSDLRIVDAAHPSWIVRLDPAVDNYLGDGSRLRESGMVLSRIVNRGADSINRFALVPKGTTYFWVQGVGGVLRGVLISTDSAGYVVRRVPVRVRSDTTYHHRAAQPLARFRTDSMAAAMSQCSPGCPRTGWCWGDSSYTAVW